MKSFRFQGRECIIKTKEQMSEWHQDFEKLRAKILLSNDSKKLNYSSNRFNLEEQEEITVVFSDNNIIAFSSLFNREYYPKELSRVLNRMWKSTEIRKFTRPYVILTRCMLELQIKKALALKKSGVFISIENRFNWLKKFNLQLKKGNKKWICLKKEYKVAPGNDPSCWQYVAFLPLKKDYQLIFPNRITV